MEVQQANSYLLQHVSSIIDRQLDQILQEQLGIGQSQAKIIHILRTQQEVTQRRLADSLGQTEASVSRQIKILLSRGLLTSQTNPKSRREHSIVLTAKGIKISEAAQAVADRYTQSLFDGLSEKGQTHLMEVLVRMHAITCQAGKLTACDHPYAL